MVVRTPIQRINWAVEAHPRLHSVRGCWEFVRRTAEVPGLPQAQNGRFQQLGGALVAVLFARWGLHEALTLGNSQSNKADRFQEKSVA